MPKVDFDPNVNIQDYRNQINEALTESKKLATEDARKNKDRIAELTAEVEDLTNTVMILTAQDSVQEKVKGLSGEDRQAVIGEEFFLRQPKQKVSLYQAQDMVPQIQAAARLDLMDFINGVGEFKAGQKQDSSIKLKEFVAKAPRLEEFRNATLSSGTTGDDAGNLIQTSVHDQIVYTQTHQGFCQKYCRMIQRPTAAPMDYGYVNDTGSYSKLPSENTAAGDAADIDWLTAKADPEIIQVGQITISKKALSAGEVNFEQEIEHVMRQRQARTYNKEFTNGTRGFTTKIPVGRQVNVSNTAITHIDVARNDGLIFYDNSPSYVFVANKTEVNNIATLQVKADDLRTAARGTWGQDENGRFWITENGVRCVSNAEFPKSTDPRNGGQIRAVQGAFEYFYIVDVPSEMEFNVDRSSAAVFTKGQVVFDAIMFADSALVLPDAFIKYHDSP